MGTRSYYTISVADGMKYLVRFQYQLVIIDVSPEKGDGFRALNKVREFTTVPILTISTNVNLVTFLVAIIALILSSIAFLLKLNGQLFLIITAPQAAGSVS